MAMGPESGGPLSEEPGAGKPPGSPEEALRRLEQRLDQASEAAERLIAEAAAEAASGGAPSKIPPAGWQVAGESSSAEAPDVDLLVHLFRSLRDLMPPDLQRRLAAAVREVLLALRALIDWYLERFERRRAESVQVQDIPIL